MTDETSTSLAGKRKRGRGANPDQTKRDLVTAAIQSLVEEGFGGTTARSIATRAHCNQAAIYYHFGGIEQLLIAGLRTSSEERLSRYRQAIPDDANLNELMTGIEVLYREDRDSGHLSLLTEMVGGITASPELREGIEEATAPWLAFIEERIRVASESLSYGGLVPAADLADLVFSIVVGVEMRNKLDGNVDRSDRLLRIASLAASLATASND